MRVRVKFTKTGCLKFIGHLDVMRYFQKALRRAEIPVALSEGFSPHMIMSFAQPLGVGKTSSGEYFDVDLSENMDPEELAERLNAEMVPGISVVRASAVPSEKKYKAMSMVDAASYIVSFRKGRSPFPQDNLSAQTDNGSYADSDSSSDLCDRSDSGRLIEDADLCGRSDTGRLIEEFLSGEEIPVTKKTKKGEERVNIRPLIYSFSYGILPPEFMICHPSGAESEREAFYMTVSAKSGTNLKPELLLHALADRLGADFGSADILIHRTDTLHCIEHPDLTDSEEKTNPNYKENREHFLVPLDDPRAFVHD